MALVCGLASLVKENPPKKKAVGRSPASLSLLDKHPTKAKLQNEKKSDVHFWVGAKQTNLLVNEERCVSHSRVDMWPWIWFVVTPKTTRTERELNWRRVLCVLPVSY